MAPENPPLPVPRSFPFQPLPAGIQTSILISESGVGVAVAATRQNGDAIVSARGAPGGVKAPAGTSCAAVTVTSASFSEVSSAQFLTATSRPAPASRDALAVATSTAITPAPIHRRMPTFCRFDATAANICHPKGFAPRTPRHAPSLAAAPAHSGRVARSLATSSGDYTEPVLAAAARPATH